MRQALIYQPDERIRKLAAAWMNSLGIRVRIVGESELKKPVSELLGLSGIFASEREETDPMINPIPPVTMLSGFTEEDLDSFLSAKKAAGITGTGLLSVVTPVNIGWPIEKLARELFREHEEIRKLEKP